MVTAVEDVGRAVPARRLVAIAVAGALAGAGLLHLAFAPEHLAEQTSHGVFFLTVAWVQLAAAALIAFGRAPRWSLFGIAALNVAVIVVWVVSRTAGIDGTVEQVGFADALASAFEVIAVGGSLLLALGWVGPMVSEYAMGATVGMSLAAVIALVSASLVPALGGGHNHAHDEAGGHVHGADAAHEHSDAASDDGHAHDDSASSTTDDGHGSHDDTEVAGATATNESHGHSTTTTTTAAHNDDHTTTTTAPGHGHTDPVTGDDWATTRRNALFGGVSPQRLAAVQADSRQFLESNLRGRSALLKGLPEADREARVDVFAQWQSDNALNAEHGDHSVGNHTDGPAAWIPMGPAETIALQAELKAAATNIAKYPTAADAMKGGYFQVTPWVAGIGAHYLNASYIGKFEPEHPSILLYNGNKPTSVIVGVSHAVLSATEPDGFSGPNDSWHRHPSLCLLGAFVVGTDATPKDMCDMVGATKGSGFGTGSNFYMMHLWQVPGWESSWGLFSSESPALNFATTDVGT